MKVHIALVGGQTAPVANVILDLEPDKVVLVCSDGTYKQAETIKEVVKRDNVEIVRISTDDMPSVRAKVEGLARTYANDEVSVNISSGMKPWAHYFSVVFSNPALVANAKVLYVDQNNNLYDLIADKPILKINFRIEIAFPLKGAELGSFKTLSDFTPEDIKATKSIENLRNFSVPCYNAVFQDEDQDPFAPNLPNPRKEDVGNRSRISYSWETDEDLQCVVVDVSTMRFGMQKSLENVKIKSPHVFSLFRRSGWFELKVADILSRWQKTKDIYMNLRFKSERQNDLNEVDVLVVTENKMLFVECKTIARSTDVDKFAAVVRNYGGTASKGLMITHAKGSEQVKRKCSDNIVFYSLQENGNKEEPLFQLLDKSIGLLQA